MSNYIVVENKTNGMDAIKLLDEPFSGIIYTYGRVQFEEDNYNDVLKIKFEYEILDDAGKKFSDNKPFETYIGNVLQDLIHRGIQENSITYTGGLDENRDSDTVKFDSK